MDGTKSQDEVSDNAEVHEGTAEKPPVWSHLRQDRGRGAHQEQRN